MGKTYGQRTTFKREQLEVRTRHMVHISKQGLEKHNRKGEREEGIGEVGIGPQAMVLLAIGLLVISKMVKKKLFNCAKDMWAMC